jgi:type IV pilus assembly protein PilF
LSLRRLFLAPAGLAFLLILSACQTTSTTITDGKPMPAEPQAQPADAAQRAQLRLELASGYFARGQASTALEEVGKALALEPNMGEAYNLRGLIYASTGDDALAEESFRRALQINARDADTMHNLGWFYCQRRRYAEASTLFTQALAVPQYHDTSRTFLAQGVCQARAGQNQDAERSLMRAYELDPTNPAAAVNLSEVLLRNGQYERARFYIRRVNSQPDAATAQTLWLAARIERRMGNVQGVQDFGRQLRTRFPQSPEALAYESGRFDD